MIYALVRCVVYITHGETGTTHLIATSCSLGKPAYEGGLTTAKIACQGNNLTPLKSLPDGLGDGERIL